MTEKKNIIIESDPGIDDATALLYASKCENLNIMLLSCAGGNSPMENIVSNALHIVEIFDMNVPVSQGSLTPLCRPSIYPISAQGKSGFGGYIYNKKRLKLKPLDGESCDNIYKTLISTKEKTTILSIGPMTNIAKMLQKYPDAKKHIKEIVFMGGTKERIYGRPYKEFNIGYDPEAADVVLKSKIPLVMVPMELGHMAYLNFDEIKVIKKMNKTGKLLAKMYSEYHDFHVGDYGAAVHDPCAVFYLAHPELIKTEKGFIEIKYYQENGENFGYIDIDFEKKPNATICVDVDIDAFKSHLFEIISKCK